MAKPSKNFWTSAPGIITAVATLLTAAATAYVMIRDSKNPDRTMGGMWYYTMRSNVSGSTYQGSLNLEQNGIHLSGLMETWDKSNGAIKGIVDGGRVTLTRDTGLNTIQTFTLSGTSDSLEGTFLNTGVHLDNGTINLHR